MPEPPSGQRETKPNPDPTVATIDAVERGDKAERDFVLGQIAVLVERLNGMDEATKVLNTTVTRVPTDVQEKVGRLSDVVFEKFKSIATQFKERDIRSEREARDNKVAVDAAFAAQKEAAAKQEESGQKSITKNETSTNESINKLAELFKSTTDALSAQIADIKTRVERIESSKQGGNDVVATGRANMALIFSGMLFLLAIAGFILSITLGKG